MKILIADDQQSSRFLLQKALELMGYEVTAVSDGMAAREQLCQPDAPQLALLDWMMPGLDGASVCREVRRNKNDRYTYLILLTSRGSKQDVVQGLESGADDYLTKPFDHDELRERLRTGLRILELEDRLVAAREQMRHQATHDQLTGLWNRRATEELLDSELARAHREDTPVTILLCDLDHFKLINDTYGHGVGDEVLQQAAYRMKKSLRSYDHVGRYGGEEFIFVLSGCDIQAAESRAEQIRSAIAETPFTTTCGPLAVTISMGLLVIPGGVDAFREGILKEVDEALYEAKHAGRNCVRSVSLCPR